MKHFFHKNGIWLLALLAAAAVGLCVLSTGGSRTDFLQNAAGVIASPFRAAGSAVSQWFGDLEDHFASVEELQKENEELKKDNAELRDALRQAQADSEENERLRELTGLRQQRRDLSFESARIIERSTSNWSRMLTLNKGSSLGVEQGDCVIDQLGSLVGVVTEVGLNWCSVTTILDTDSEIGALVYRTGEATVAQGELELMGQGKLKLSYLAGESSLINGDLIVTSGLGGYYPADLVIGSVEEIRTDDNGLTRYAVICPQTDIEALTQVFIITDFTIID